MRTMYFVPLLGSIVNDGSGGGGGWGAEPYNFYVHAYQMHVYILTLMLHVCRGLMLMMYMYMYVGTSLLLFLVPVLSSMPPGICSCNDDVCCVVYNCSANIQEQHVLGKM